VKKLGYGLDVRAGVLGTVLALGIAPVAMSRTMIAQDAPAGGTIHGKVLNAAGSPIKSGQVKLTTDKSGANETRKYKYTFEIGPDGTFKGADIAPGQYLGVVVSEGKTVDYQDNVNFKAGEDHTVDFDMSRKEYIDKMTPEEKKNLEEYKKKNADASAANSKIANLNAMLVQARADTKAGNYDAAITAMQQATAAKPDEGILWLTLGDAQLGQANAAQAAARTAHTSPMDQGIVDKFSAAEVSYQKAVDLNAVSKKPSPETAAAAENQLGQAYGKSGKNKEAADAYDTAAKALPANAGMYYYNEAATLFNAGATDDAASAADKAIAADPKRADAYYIKGQSLISKATVDPKTQLPVAPAGCLDAYQMYLQLAPDGPHAADVKQILAGFGQKIQTNYKAGKK